MKKLLLGFQIVFFLVLTVSLADATPVILPAESTVVVDGQSYTLVTPPGDGGLMWESGNRACLCTMMAFRALQAFGLNLGLGEFDSRRITVTTGWNTHGPEHLFVEALSWQGNFAYADPFTPGPLLTLADAWFAFVYQGSVYHVASHYNNYRFSPERSNPGHVEGWDFFAYRTAVQTGQATAAQKIYFRDIIRPQIVANLEGRTWFEVTVAPVPLPGTLGLLAAGLAKMAARRWQSRT